MNSIFDFLKNYQDKNAIIWEDKIFKYGDILGDVIECKKILEAHFISRGNVVSLESDFSPKNLAFFLALVEIGAIIVPFSSFTKENLLEFTQVANVEFAIKISDGDEVSISKTGLVKNNILFDELNQDCGLVIFSSGSTGKSKAILHNLKKMIESCQRKDRLSKVIIAFLLFDHMGGINTMLHSLLNGDCLVVLKKRDTENVFRSIEKYRVQVLPTSPTFLNLILLNNDYAKYDLSSLEVIKYGSEPINQFVLDRIIEILPKVKIKQTYGLSEIGVLSIKSKNSSSPLIKFTDDNFKVRIVDEMIEIKSDASFIGYLNDGGTKFEQGSWFKTGDLVREEGEYLQIIGRDSDIINIGGLKVFPLEIENLIRKMDNISDVVIAGEKNVFVGNIIVAKIRLTKEEPALSVQKRIREFLKDKVENYKIPQKLELIDYDIHNQRFKTNKQNHETKNN